MLKDYHLKKPLKSMLVDIELSFMEVLEKFIVGNVCKSNSATSTADAHGYL